MSKEEEKGRCGKGCKDEKDRAIGRERIGKGKGKDNRRNKESNTIQEGKQ